MNVTPQPLPAQPAPTAQARKPQQSGGQGPRDNGDYDGTSTSSTSSTTTTPVESSDAIDSTNNGGEPTESTTVTFADVLAALMTNVVQTQTDANANANIDDAVISLTDGTTPPTTPVSPALALEALQVLGVSTTAPETSSNAIPAMPTTAVSPTIPPAVAADASAPTIPTGELPDNAPATGTTLPTANPTAEQGTTSIAESINNDNVGVTITKVAVNADVVASPAQAHNERIANLPSTANPRAVEATADNIHAGKKSAPVSGPTSGTPVVESSSNISAVTATQSDVPAVDTTPPTTFGPATMALLDRTMTIRDPRMPGQLPRAANEFAQQLVGQLTPLRTSGTGTYTMTLHLRPEGLGNVNVDVRLKDGTIDLSFRVQAPETREMVRMSIGDLRSQLDQAGVNSGHVDVGDMAREFGRQQNDATSDTNAKLGDFVADEETDSSITTTAVQGRAATSTTDRAVNVHL